MNLDLAIFDEAKKKDDFTDTERLDWLNKQRNAISGSVGRWYWNSPKGLRRFTTIREAIDAGMLGK